MSAPVLASGGTGNTLDPRAPFTRLVPGGAEWGSAPDWVGFLRPTQALDRQWTQINTEPEAVGFHLHRTYVEPTTGTAVSLMGNPTGDGHLFPGDPMSCGYEFAVGRPR